MFFSRKKKEKTPQNLEENVSIREEEKEQLLPASEEELAEDAVWIRRLMSHNLRMPMTIIKGYSDLYLSDSLDNEEEIKEAIIKINENIDYMNDVLKVLIDCTTESLTKKEPFSVLETVKQASKFVGTIASKSKIKIMVTSSKEDVFINGNRTDFMRAMFNLFENSIKYMKNEGIINVTVEEENDEVFVIYRDTGQGMDMSNLATEDLIRVEGKVEDSTGNGIGMFLVGEMVKRHGGTISIKSAVGKGFRVEMVFPKNL